MQLALQNLCLLAGAALACSTLAPAQNGQDPESRNARVTPIVEIVRRVGPTVVNLYADLEVEGWLGPQEAASLGSGVIIHPSGIIVTNAHVITGNIDPRAAQLKQITVSDRPDWSGSGTPEMKKFRATVLGFDRTNDLALLQIQAPGPFPAARLGTSSDLMVGETVIAVGNPLGREGSVTHGIVSATHRTLASPTGTQFDDLIQTDASLNSGNSGGPLFNILGELIGINEAIAGDQRFGRAEGQGLAIPVDRVRALLEGEFNPYDLLKVWIGLDVANKDGGGVVVRKVDRDGPAAKAGLLAGDTVVKVGKYDVQDRTAFNLSVCSFDPEDRIPLVVSHDGRRRDLTVQPVAIGSVIRERLGATLGVSGRLVVVNDVAHDGPAARLGLHRDDVLVELGGHSLDSLQTVFETLQRAERGAELKVVIRRYVGGRRPREFEGDLRL